MKLSSPRQETIAIQPPMIDPIVNVESSNSSSMPSNEVQKISPTNVLPPTKTDQQGYSIARDRPRREIQPPLRFAHADCVAYTLAVNKLIIQMNHPLLKKQLSLLLQINGYLLCKRKWNHFERIVPGI